jgi:hypothetical protein
LYSPQDVDAIARTVSDLVRDGSGLCQACLDDLNSQQLTDAAALLTIGKEGEAGAEAATLTPAARELKWLGLWRTQIEKENGKWQEAVTRG